MVCGLFADQVHFWTGLLLGTSQYALPIGMVGYNVGDRRLQHDAFAWFGAFLVACMVLAGKCAENTINHVAMGILVFLGVVASGIGRYVELRRDAGGRRNAQAYE